MTEPNKILFFGTSEFSAGILAELHLKYPLVGVITQPDKPVGRNHEIKASPVALLATQSKLPLFKPASLKDPQFEELVSKLNPDIFVVVAYGKIIPQNILELAKRGAINIHGSLLPKYRGASPIHSALLNGEEETGITIMLMDAQMDHGPLLSAQKVEIQRDETFPELEKNLAFAAKQLILETIPKYLTKEITPIPQDESLSSFTKIIAKADGKVLWQNKSSQIYNQFRAYYVWPGIWTNLEDKVLKIKNCQTSAEKSNHGIGVVYQLEDKILVQCGEGSLELIEVQPEGKKSMPIKSFIAGHRNFIGSQLH
ncbi:MAG: methionyl-tRNA formyltransferase [Candidatus Doudnabacteria bacterium]